MYTKQITKLFANTNNNLIDATLQVWQPRLQHDLTQEDARQIAENVVGFFAVLGEWSRFDRPIPANATRKPASLPGAANSNLIAINER